MATSRLKWDTMLERQRRARIARLRGALQRCGWSIKTAADELKVGTSTLQSLIETHDLADDYAENSPNAGRRGRPRKVQA